MFKSVPQCIILEFPGTLCQWLLVTFWIFLGIPVKHCIMGMPYLSSMWDGSKWLFLSQISNQTTTLLQRFTCLYVLTLILAIISNSQLRARIKLNKCLTYSPAIQGNWSSFFCWLRRVWHWLQVWSRCLTFWIDILWVIRNSNEEKTDNWFH